MTYTLKENKLYSILSGYTNSAHLCGSSDHTCHSKPWDCPYRRYDRPSSKLGRNNLDDRSYNYKKTKKKQKKTKSTLINIKHIDIYTCRVSYSIFFFTVNERRVLSHTHPHYFDAQCTCLMRVCILHTNQCGATLSSTPLIRIQLELIGNFFFEKETLAG